jgi:SRSO17 transposase
MKLRTWKRVEGDANPPWIGDREWVRDPLAYWVHPGWERWLLTGRSVVQPDEYSYYRAYVPEETSLAELARIASTSLAVQEGLERAKDEVGLDQYEVRRWDAWHRHITLCLLAHAALQVARAGVKGEPGGRRHAPQRGRRGRVGWQEA